MGYAITWFAFRAGEAQALFHELALAPTGETDEGPDALIATTPLKNDWQILWYNRYGCPFLDETALQRLSDGREIFRCLIEEHVMASTSELWSGGRRRWRLAHKGENGPKGLDFEGELPDCFQKVREQMESNQAAEGGDQAKVDYIFEIPLCVAKELVGFKHDETNALMAQPAFSVLSRTEERKGGLLSRIFGRK